MLWDSIKTPGELEEYFKNNCSVSASFFQEHEEGKRFFEILLKCKRENKTEADLKNVSEFQEAGKIFNDLLRKIKYKDKKVVI
jgi:hypothetical protein